ncbi:hypothetical protein NQD34_009232 [Periophthalmus magnuspinnatus]|nr:hypothetical protein NQD34_009232 [Periophthalmus magnuspinnatus]
MKLDSAHVDELHLEPDAVVTSLSPRPVCGHVSSGLWSRLVRSVVTSRPVRGQDALLLLTPNLLTPHIYLLFNHGIFFDVLLKNQRPHCLLRGEVVGLIPVFCS